MNTTENYYFCKLDSANNRLDAAQRPDLSSGSYEFVANKTYCFYYNSQDFLKFLKNFLLKLTIVIINLLL